MKNFNKILAIIISFLTVFIIGFLTMSPKAVLADESDERNITCSLCTKSVTDPLYKKEMQFYQKINVIAEKYGNKIDKVALASTVLHRYGADSTYNALYDENFQENEYGEMISSFTDLEKALTIKNEQIDLLTLAAIVMADSSDGTYNEDKFLEALSGDRLVRNNEDEENISEIRKRMNDVINTIVCSKELINGSSAGAGDSGNVAAVSEQIRRVNLKNVCENGYIGGLYGNVKDIADVGLKQATKEKYAREIKAFIEYYRLHYGRNNADSCTVNNAGKTGEFSAWKQGDSRWGSINLGTGGSTVRNAGCTVTSVAMQIARSGTRLGALPEGYTEFNPGAFVTVLNQNNGFAGSAFSWSGFSTIAPNWRDAGYKEVNTSSHSVLADAVSKELSSGYEVDGKNYQKFLILYFKAKDHPMHWVAINGVENGKVTFYDPGINATTLDGYTNWYANGYRVMYATDVEYGSTGVSNLSSDECGDDFVQSYLKWVNIFEGYDTCNYKGRGEGTGYKANIVSGDAGGWTTYPGITMNTGKSIAHRMGYTDWETDIMNQCVDKQQLDRIAPVVVQELFLDKVQAELSSRNINANTAQVTSLVSVAWGGSDNEVTIMDAYKQYGQNSTELLNAFRSTFGGGMSCSTKFSNGLMKRRLSEYELFMTGNYKSNAESYYRSCSYSASLSKEEIMSYWPTGN